ncbi:hypothetical protein CHRYSEOSP005_11770 [Chryseobacterium sp. Alg-005]|uniref:hypothetical protein n=1 Tax=Chryseobacterium sp. Alg-005 TaxID=3159516 RepID=UPI0035556877
MSDRIIQIVMEDGSSFNYEEKPLQHFLDKIKDENFAKYMFQKQHDNWQEEAMSYFDFDLEKYAKDKYDLVDADEVNDLGDFSDSDILEEAEGRCLINNITVDNSNIMNEDFIDRFVAIINRGNNVEIENTLSFLEYKYKI